MLPDLKHARLAAGLKWGLGLAAAALLAPVIFLAVRGLVGLVVAGVVGLVLVHGAPLASRWMATVALQGFKGLARTNPIETRQLISQKRRGELEASLQAIRAFSAEVRNVENHAIALKQANDEVGYNELYATFEKLDQVLEARKRAYQRAVEAADEYDKVTEKVARRWKAAQAALKAQKLAGSAASKELDRIMSEEAVESVDTALNTVFADLETTLLSENIAIEHKPTDVIEVSAVRVKEYA